jgi:SsrA-binding protein
MLLLENRKARQEYEVLETYSAGIVLSGGEVKSLRNKSGSLVGSYVKIIGGEVVLLNAQITPYTFADNREYDPKQTRKLLLRKREIIDLAEKIDTKGYTLVPLSFELVGRVIKLKFGLARGKKQYEKRADLKKKAIERDIQREVRDKVRIR